MSVPPDPTGEPPRLRPCVLLPHGETFLKGRNRGRFERLLHDNLRYALRGHPGGAWIRAHTGLTVVGGQHVDDELIERVGRVPGFAVVLPAVAVPSTPEAVDAAAVAVLAEHLRTHSAATFAVRCRRRNKRFPLRSGELAARLGAVVLAALPLTVRLDGPDVELRVDVDGAETYLSCRRIRGHGGLPVGASGRALVLLSGGYDSPVAAYRAMRRGLRCDFVHFSGVPYTDPSSTYKAYALARELNRYQPPGALHLIALGTAQRQLAVAGAGRLQVLAQRRLMLRTAQALARRAGLDALVTGDSLGQVASQTLANLATLDEAVHLPVLRPLLGWDKQEIIAEARTLGTAPVSELADEDCCRLLAPDFPVTRSSPDQLRPVEARIDLDAVVDTLLDQVRTVTPDPRHDNGIPPQ